MLRKLSDYSRIIPDSLTCLLFLYYAGIIAAGLASVNHICQYYMQGSVRVDVNIIYR